MKDLFFSKNIPALFFCSLLPLIFSLYLLNAVMVVAKMLFNFLLRFFLEEAECFTMMIIDGKKYRY